VTWICKPWSALDRDEVYRILALRQRVFVVEQACAYLDADGLDAPAHHLWTERDGAIAAYLRIHPPGAKYAEASLGRIATAPEHRGTGLGRAVVVEGLRQLDALFGRVPIRIGAQKYLERFYGELGFARDGDDYDEDGIPHVEMIVARR
jgi:ElaA protein